MVGNYEVVFQGEPAGNVQVEQSGLYYSFCCRCAVVSEEVCRIIVYWDGGWENLGIPIPDADGLSLTKKIPCKRTQDKNMKFLLLPCSEKVEEVLARQNSVDISSVGVEEETEPTIIIEEQQNQLQENEEGPETSFCAIDPEEPFEMLDQLEHARLSEKEGILGAVFEEYRPEDQNSSVNPTGQWSEPMISE